jgi:hypothetical protein
MYTLFGALCIYTLNQNPPFCCLCLSYLPLFSCPLPPILSLPSCSPVHTHCPAVVRPIPTSWLSNSIICLGEPTTLPQGKIQIGFFSLLISYVLYSFLLLSLPLQFPLLLPYFVFSFQYLFQQYLSVSS